MDENRQSEQQPNNAPHSVSGAMVPTSPLHGKIDTILSRIANGEYQSSIAKDYGVSQSAISQAIRDNPLAAIAKEVGIEARLDERTRLMENAARDIDDGERAPDAQLILARVKAHETILRRLEWRASVEMPNRWGQRPQTQVNVGGNQVSVAIVSYNQVDAPQVSDG